MKKRLIKHKADLENAGLELHRPRPPFKWNTKYNLQFLFLIISKG